MIKQITEDDWQHFSALRLEALQADPAAYSGTAEEWQNLSELALRNLLKEISIFVDFGADGPIGMMGLVRQRASKMAHRAMLVMVYLRLSSRGSGVAASLHSAVVTYAKSVGIRQIELAVTAENPRAAEFYRKLGYVHIGNIPGGFLHEEREIDELMMALRT